jgi:uncharacterized protein (TIGR02001 family)|tara:strand:- start:422 stop:1183 length:762 start_codon:yes stop_codon:yes gene_type:complete
MKKTLLFASTILFACAGVNATEYSWFSRENLKEVGGIDLSYNASWSSHYVWRGESQSSKDMSPAIGADLSHTSGFYTGLWTGAITNSAIPSEFDWYFGYATDLGPISVDIGDLYYFYPGQSDETEFNEYYLSLGTDISITDNVSISPYVYLAYAPKWFGPNTPEAFYSEFGADVPIAGTPFTLSGLFGNIDISDCEGDAEKGNCTDSWNYYYITLGFGEIFGLDASATFHSAAGSYNGDAGQDGMFVSLGHEW